MMISTRMSIITYVYKTCFHTSSSISANLGKTMKKIMGKSKKIKNQDPAALPSPLTFSKGSNTRKTEISRRGIVLNKLFMRHVTDLMATGQYSTEITGHGIEISRVKMSSDYNVLRIYWYTRGQLNDTEVESLLNKNAGYLKHELSQLRVMGNVPSVLFVKDKYYGSVAEVDKRLAIADFGDDYVPLDTGIRFKSEFQIFTPLEDHIKEKIEELDAESNSNEFMLPLPLMTHNIYGVDHASILEKVKKSKKQLTNLESDEYSNKDWAQFKLTQPINEDPVHFDNQKSQAFREFLHKHQMLKAKAKKIPRYDPHLEYLKDEFEDLKSFRASFDNSFNDDLKEEEDYITEDIDKKD